MPTTTTAYTVRGNYAFFWQGPLSQWHPSPFRNKEGVTFGCAEQYMMWRKALLFHDTNMAKRILAASSPRDQKALGRKVAGFNAFVWEREAVEIVRQGNILKFMQNPELEKILLSTLPHRLAEASPYDVIWGIGRGVNAHGIEDPKTWRGQNLLGKALEQARDFLHARQRAAETEREVAATCGGFSPRG